MAALLFPPILADSQNMLPTLFAITIFGGMIGSILTIINPVAILIRWIYIWITENWFLKNLRVSSFVNKVLTVNYRFAVKSPSVSFEIDKIVGMFYFIIILIVALARLSSDNDFITILGLSEFNKNIALLASTLGVLGVSTILIIYVLGTQSISLLRKIITVTILFSATDFNNLSTEAEKVRGRYTYGSDRFILVTNEQIKKLNKKRKVTIEIFKKDIDFQTIFHVAKNELKSAENDEQIIERCWKYFKSLQEISKRYNLEIIEIFPWLQTGTFFGRGEFDTIISQLQTSVESRDWKNATLISERITNRCEDVFISKGLII